MQEKKLFLLDAYALIYRSYYAFIKNPRINSKGLNTSAIFGFVNTLEDVLKKEQPTHIAVGFDPAGPTFRHKAYEQYKAQREATPEDIRKAIPIIKDIIKAYNIPIIEVAGYEADDVIGSMAQLAEKAGYDTYMMTPDKDYGQLVSDHIFIYKPKYGSNGFEIRGIEEIKQKFGIEQPKQVIDILGLMGDASDNIPGCPGIGEKTATKLIQEFGSIEELLNNTDKLKGALRKKVEENIEQIKFSKFLATIKTDVPLTFDEEELCRCPVNANRLREIFDELEFKNLAERVLSETINKTTITNTPIQGSLFDVFTADSQDEKKYSILSELKSTPHNYYLIDNENKMRDLAQKLNLADSFAFDTETTGIEPMRVELVGLSFSLQENEAYYIPIPPNKEEAKLIVNIFKEALENTNSLKIGQNIKYDYIVLKNYGVTVKGQFFDTMIAHYLLQPEQRHNMDYLAEVYLHYKTIPIEDLIGPKGKGQLSMRDVPLEKICEYAAEDADITLKLKNILEKELHKENLENLFYTIEMPLVRVLSEMEITGVNVDTEVLSQYSLLLSNKIDILEKEIYEMEIGRAHV